MTTAPEEEGCTWQVGGSYPDTPPEQCELESDPESDDGFCTKHEAASRAMEEWEKQFPPDMENV
jgi:hypothetical protein